MLVTTEHFKTGNYDLTNLNGYKKQNCDRCEKGKLKLSDFRIVFGARPVLFDPLCELYRSSED